MGGKKYGGTGLIHIADKFPDLSGAGYIDSVVGSSRNRILVW
jgi:hypothetical protein